MLPHVTWFMIICMALPARLGGLGLINPVVLSTEQHITSKIISAPLVERVLQQNHPLMGCHEQAIKSRARSNKKPEEERMPKVSKDTFQLPFNVVWIFPRRKGLHQHGWQHCLLTNMGFCWFQVLTAVVGHVQFSNGMKWSEANWESPILSNRGKYEEWAAITCTKSVPLLHWCSLVYSVYMYTNNDTGHVLLHLALNQKIEM